MLQRRTEVANRRKEMGNKRCHDIKLRQMKARRPPTQSQPRIQSHNMKSSYKQQSGRNLKTHVIQTSHQEKSMSRHQFEVAT